MTGKPVRLRQQADADIDEALSYYLGEGLAEAATGFLTELERALTHIARHPGTGSTRYAHALGLPGLRSWPLTRFPHLLFYVERNDHVDVWRVLHGSRDIPAWMTEPEIL